MAILHNVSRRLYVINGVKISPTAAVKVPDEFLDYPGVKQAIASGELQKVEKEREPIIDKAEAQKDSNERKKAGTKAVGTATKRSNRALPRAAQATDPDDSTDAAE